MKAVADIVALALVRALPWVAGTVLILGVALAVRTCIYGRSVAPISESLTMLGVAINLVGAAACLRVWWAYG